MIMLMLLACTTVDAGHVGVPTYFGKVGDQVMTEGLHSINPLTTTVHHIDTRIQKFTVDAVATSSDLQNVTSTIALNYRVDTDQALTLFQNIGMDYRATILTPVLQESIKTVTAKYTAAELISSRPEVKAKIFELVTDNTKKSHLIVTDLSIENFSFSDAYAEAIEHKQVAEQLAQQAKNDLTRIQIEAQQKEAEAQGEAKATLARAQAEAESLRLQRSVLTPELLQLRWIEKWDGHMPKVSAGSQGSAIVAIQGI